MAQDSATNTETAVSFSLRIEIIDQPFSESSRGLAATVFSEDRVRSILTIKVYIIRKAMEFG
jgi:hypothetical protein